MITDKQARKDRPVFSGVLAYFPDALLEVAWASKVGNDQHNAGQPLHWAKEKSQDEPDALVRHMLDHLENPMDDDGVLHLAKSAWRALANLQRYLDEQKLQDLQTEAERFNPLDTNSTFSINE